MRETVRGARGARCIPGRVTYVIDRHHVVRQVFSSMTDIDGHVNDALRMVKELQAEQPAVPYPRQGGDRRPGAPAMARPGLRGAGARGGRGQRVVAKAIDLGGVRVDHVDSGRA